MQDDALSVRQFWSHTAWVGSHRSSTVYCRTVLGKLCIFFSASVSSFAMILPTSWAACEHYEIVPVHYYLRVWQNTKEMVVIVTIGYFYNLNRTE